MDKRKKIDKKEIISANPIDSFSIIIRRDPRAGRPTPQTDASGLTLPPHTEVTAFCRHRHEWAGGSLIFPHGQRGYFNIYILITCQFTHCMFRLGLCTRNQPGLACSMNSFIHSLHGRRLRSQPTSKEQSATIHTRVICNCGAAIPARGCHTRSCATL